MAFLWRRLKYVRENMPREAQKKYAHRWAIDVDFRKLICLRNARDVRAFHAKYAVKLDLGANRRATVIDWSRVARENVDKCGIYIKDAHIKGLRDFHIGQKTKTQKDTEDFTWYTTFDVCSACVWSGRCLNAVSTP